MLLNMDELIYFELLNMISDQLPVDTPMKMLEDGRGVQHLRKLRPKLYQYCCVGKTCSPWKPSLSQPTMWGEGVTMMAVTSDTRWSVIETKQFPTDNELVSLMWMKFDGSFRISLDQASVKVWQWQKGICECYFLVKMRDCHVSWRANLRSKEPSGRRGISQCSRRVIPILIVHWVKGIYYQWKSFVWMVYRPNSYN